MSLYEKIIQGIHFIVEFSGKYDLLLPGFFFKLITRQSRIGYLKEILNEPQMDYSLDSP